MAITTDFTSDIATQNGYSWSLYYSNGYSRNEGTSVERKTHHIRIKKVLKLAGFTEQQINTLKRRKRLPNYNSLLCWPFLNRIEYITISKYGRYYTLVAVSYNDYERYRLRTKVLDQVNEALQGLTGKRYNVTEKIFSFTNPLTFNPGSVNGDVLTAVKDCIAGCSDKLAIAEATITNTDSLTNQDLGILLKVMNLEAQVDDLMQYVVELENMLPPSEVIFESGENL